MHKRLLCASAIIYNIIILDCAFATNKKDEISYYSSSRTNKFWRQCGTRTSAYYTAPCQAQPRPYLHSLLYLHYYARPTSSWVGHCRTWLVAPDPWSCRHARGITWRRRMRRLWHYDFNKVDCSHITVCRATAQPPPLTLHKIQLFGPPWIPSPAYREFPSPPLLAVVGVHPRCSVGSQVRWQWGLLFLSFHPKLVSTIVMSLPTMALHLAVNTTSRSHGSIGSPKLLGLDLHWHGLW